MIGRCVVAIAIAGAVLVGAGGECDSRDCPGPTGLAETRADGWRAGSEIFLCMDAERGDDPLARRIGHLPRGGVLPNASWGHGAAGRFASRAGFPSVMAKRPLSRGSRSPGGRRRPRRRGWGSSSRPALPRHVRRGRRQFDRMIDVRASPKSSATIGISSGKRHDLRSAWPSPAPRDPFLVT